MEEGGVSPMMGTSTLSVGETHDVAAAAIPSSSQEDVKMEA